MARYPELIVERATDDSVAINNVSNARRTQPEPAFNIEQPAYLPRSIAPKVERSSDGLTEALHSVRDCPRGDPFFRRDAPLFTWTARHRQEAQEVKGKMTDKLRGRSRGVLDALREG